MRGLFTVLLISGMALGQAVDPPKPDVSSGAAPAAAATAPEAIANPSKANPPTPRLNASIDILNDTGGVSFANYRDAVRNIVLQNWYKGIAELAKDKTGGVTIQFSVARDGTISGLRLASGSGDAELDRAAEAAITSSNPLPPLPDEFQAEFLDLRFRFQYHLEKSAAADAIAAPATPNPAAITIPEGTKISLSLAQAISTKNAHEGDAVYATTAFPFVMNSRVIIPAGSYIQGSISHVERAGHGHGRAEILMHFTSIIFPSGYTVMLPGSIENTPGADNKSVKDQEGTIQQDKETGKKVEDAAQTGAYGGAIGGIGGGLATGSLNGARIGAGAGAAAGIAYALLKRGSDVNLPVGTSIEMEIQRPVTLDAGRIAVAKAGP
ncbi:MAG: TonB family protein [Candidatus Sulfotelmatobacter sp.]